MTLLIIYIFLAIAVSFLCSIMEAVLLSVTAGHIGAMRQSKPTIAARLEKYKADIEEPLAAILSLNTVAHTVGAAGAGAQAAKVFGDTWLGVFSAVLTFAILFFSEIIPKTIGAVYWKQLTTSVVRLLAILMVPMKPFVWMSKLVSGVIASDPHHNNVSREELSALADLGEEQGVLDEGESRILRALMRFRSLKAGDIMTPRTVVFGLPSEMTAGEVVESDAPLRFSRIPVYRTSMDQLVGYALKDEILERVARDDEEHTLDTLARTLLVVPRDTPVSELLEKFLTQREHIAAVIDDYGGTEGVVTLEDVVETLLDLEIVDEADGIEDLAAAARRDWMRRAQRMGLVDEEGEPVSSQPSVPRKNPQVTDG